MKYLRNSDLIKLYTVSDKTVRNWIVASRKKKLPLELCEIKGKTYILDSVQNRVILEDIASQGKKYRNHRSHKNLKPLPEFYELFSDGQISELLIGLEKDRLLPQKYKFFGEGAVYWDRYLTELYDATMGKNLITNTMETLDLDSNYLDSQIQDFEQVNVVNMCVGNCLMLKDVLRRLKGTGKLRRVILLDLSARMLEFSEQNLRRFDLDLSIEKYIKDLEHERFGDILIRDPSVNNKKTINLVFLLGGPIVNFRNPQDIIRTTYASIGKDDLMITSLKRDTIQTRNFFSFNLETDKSPLNSFESLLMRLLGIEDSDYEVTQAFDETRKLRSLNAVLNRDLTIHFEMRGLKKSVNLRKGEVLPLWWSWHHSDDDIVNRFTSEGFDIQHLTKSKDNQLTLLTTRSNQDANRRKSFFF